MTQTLNLISKVSAQDEFDVGLADKVEYPIEKKQMPLLQNIHKQYEGIENGSLWH